jgi:hypothetical protein
VREVGAYLCVKRPVDLDAEVILTSVRFGSALLAEVDATDARLNGSEMPSVIQTDATKYRRSGRATSVPKYGRFSGLRKTSTVRRVDEGSPDGVLTSRRMADAALIEADMSKSI